jgi:hypothetical protein
VEADARKVEAEVGAADRGQRAESQRPEGRGQRAESTPSMKLSESLSICDRRAGVRAERGKQRGEQRAESTEPRVDERGYHGSRAAG